MRISRRLGIFALVLLLAPAIAAQEPQPEQAPEPSVEVERDRIEVFDESLSFAERLFGGSWERELFSVGEDIWILGDFIRAVAVLTLILALLLVSRLLLLFFVVRRLERDAKSTATPVDDALLAVWRSTKGWLLFVFAIYLSARTMPLPDTAARLLDGAALVLALVQAAIWASAALLTALEESQKRRAAEDPSAASAFGLMALLGRIVIWSAVLLLALDNLGFDVTALIAGLGVGGIAIAFAVQNILGDVFCSVAILLDKPFVVGDFIVVNDLMGTVERIGIKTTRVRSLNGEQIIFSNTDLLSSRIRNFKRMYERRVQFSLGVVYETPTEKLERIPAIVREAIERHEQTRFDRAHFLKFGPSSLDFEVVYFVLVPEYNAYMDIQQAINIETRRRFEAEDIRFAYPTRELILRSQGAAEEPA